MARNWKDVRADAVSAGKVDETRVAEIRREILDEQRAYRLAEVRKSRGATQARIAAAMGVAQSRVSAIEHGELRSTELGTLAAYVEALGGRLRLVADFGEAELVVGDAETRTPDNVSARSAQVVGRAADRATRRRRVASA